MTKLEEIKDAVSELSQEELARFRSWFEEFDARLFDHRVEQDARSGKLDWLAQEAIDDHKAGRSRKLK